MEVYHEDQWGTICDKNWAIEAAKVVCKELGYSSAIFAIKKAHFGEGTGPVCDDDYVFVSWRLVLEWFYDWLKKKSRYFSSNQK